MKTVKLFSVLALSAFVCFACKSNNTEPNNPAENAENAQENQASEAVILDSAKTAAGVAFLEDFYNVLGEDILNYEYLKQNITPNLKQYLIDQYDYECEGECLASWLFFYEGGGDTGGDMERTIEPVDNDTYLVKIRYRNTDGTYHYYYSVKLGLVKDGDSFKIDTLEKVEGHYEGEERS